MTRKDRRKRNTRQSFPQETWSGQCSWLCASEDSGFTHLTGVTCTTGGGNFFEAEIVVIWSLKSF